MPCSDPIPNDREKRAYTVVSFEEVENDLYLTEEDALNARNERLNLKWIVPNED